MSLFSPRAWVSSDRDAVGILETPVRHPSDFDRFLDDSIKTIHNLKKELDASESALEATLIIDEMSDTICRVSDLCDLLKHVHPDEQFRTSAEVAHARANQFVHELNTNVSYYNSFVSAINRSSSAGGLGLHHLSQEQNYVARLLRSDFEKSGIHLEDSKRAQVVELYSKIIDYENAFRHSSDSSVSTAILADHDFELLSSRLTPENGASIKEIYGATRKYAVTAPVDLFAALSPHCPGSHLRKELYGASLRASEETLRYLDDMLETRYELASLLGFKSFSHYSCAHRFVESPEKVIRFLNAYAESVKPQAEQDLKKLSKVKALSDDDHNIYEWDLAFTRNLLQRNLPDAEFTKPFDYLDLEKLYDGLIFLSKTVFSLNVVPSQIQQGEAWHQDVRKLSFYKNDGQLMGTLYLDLFARPEKSAIAGLFICRASRKNRQGIRQPAAVSIIASFPGNRIKNRFVISRKNVETLFHEFGHALHNILSNTQFQHTSGTRCPIDFVEVPSTLMEKFPFSTPGLSPYLYSPIAGSPLTGDIMDVIRKNRQPTKSLRIQEQILCSTVDMLYHGTRPLSADTTKLYHDTAERMTSVPPMRDTQPQGRFHHLIHYAAGYYSYVCADLVTQEIWNKVFQENPLDPKAGNSLVDQLLQHGGSKPPKTIVRDLLGDRVMENEHIRILLEEDA